MSSLKYIEEGINSNIRVDGRTLLTYRTIEINKSILVSADGSSSVMNEENNVICGIKLSLLPPEPHSIDEGFVNLQIDCPASVASKFVWGIDINVMVLNGGGGLLDIISIAIYVALNDMNIPFPCENIPICISIGEINNKYIYDMSKIEEELVENVFVVAVTSSGKCVAFHKLYGISMEVSSILNMSENSVKISQNLFKKINEAIDKIQANTIHV